MRVLVTGGAGFIGLHLCRRLLDLGHDVTVVDSFEPRVHGPEGALPGDVAEHVRLVRGDVRDDATWWAALPGQEAVVHLAAQTSTGHSLGEASLQASVNIGGTALLAETLIGRRADTVERLVLASSRAVYGEGPHRCPAHGMVRPRSRRALEVSRDSFEPVCPTCGGGVVPLPATEDLACLPASFYGLTKQAQEQTVALVAEALGLRAISLRLQNVYGPGQALRNPYAGVLALFLALARAGRPIRIFEDGRQSRDFVFVDDAVDAIVRSLRIAGSATLNIGSGTTTTLVDAATTVTGHLGVEVPLEVCGYFRVGDVRHARADVSRAGRELGWSATVPFTDGVRRLVEGSVGDGADPSVFESSLLELRSRGLLSG